MIKMTEKEKLEFMASRSGLVNCLADSYYCPPWMNGTFCVAYNMACWRAWLIGREKGLAYVDTDSMKTDLPEEMY